MTLSKDIQKQQAAYAKEHYDRILVKFPKGTKERIQSTGETVNGFINKAVMNMLEEAGK